MKWLNSIKVDFILMWILGQLTQLIWQRHERTLADAFPQSLSRVVTIASYVCCCSHYRHYSIEESDECTNVQHTANTISCIVCSSETLPRHFSIVWRLMIARKSSEWERQQSIFVCFIFHPSRGLSIKLMEDEALCEKKGRLSSVVSFLGKTKFCLDVKVWG